MTLNLSKKKKAQITKIMSHRSTRPSTSSDIIIPNEFKDFNVLPDEMRNEIASYLFSDDKCPLEAAIKKQIKPKSKVILEFQHSFDKFNNIYKTKSYYFLKIPNFTLLFAATCLGLPLKNYRHIPMNFIQSFLELLSHDSVDEGILDVIIPFTIYRVPYEEDQLSVEKLILFLAKFFTPSIFLRHLLNCLDVYIRKNKILPFHIDTLSLVYDKYNIDSSQSRDIERIILRPLENTKDNIRLELACSELRKKIQLKVNDRSFYNSTSSSVDMFSDQRSPIAAKRSVQFLDTLTILLDEIEKGQYGSPATILIQVKDELAHYSEFPHRSPEPLLTLAFRTYPFQSSNEMQSAILALIFQLNSICDPFILLKIYLQMPTSLQFQGVPSELIERCYRDFLDRRREELDRTPSYPESLFDNFNNSMSNVSARSIEEEPKNIESNDIDSRFEIEFRHLTDWDTAYDAVCAIWELIGRYKNEEIRDLLLTKFDELEYAPKSFLVQGLRELEDQKPRSEDTETTIRQLEDYFNYYMKPVSNNNSNNTSNVSISTRSTSPRIPTNTYQPEPQKIIPVPNSARLTPQDQLKRKRVIPNNTSLRTGYKTNH